MAEISQIKLPSGTAYMLKDVGALQLTGGTVTGPTTFSDTITVDDATIGTMIVTGGASFVNTIVGSVSGSSGSSKPITLTNEDLNDIMPDDTTWYYAGGGHTVTNVPSTVGTNGFGLVVYRNASGCRAQIITNYNDIRFSRYYYNGSWSSWTEWKYENTDTKVTISALSVPSGATSYYPPFHTSTSGTTGLSALAGYRLYIRAGTTSQEGCNYLCLGNSTASGTAGNMYGGITLYSNGTNHIDLKTSTLTGDYSAFLPNSTGTLINDAGGQTIKGTLRVNNILTLYREGTTANNYAAGIKFMNKDTTTGLTYEAGYLYAYQDHGAGSTNGFNMVLRSGGNMFLGSGESPSNHYALYTSSGTENTYITADNFLYAQAGGNTIANRKGFRIDASGNVIPCQADTDTNNVGTIGTSSYKWNALYVTNINGVAVGNSPKFTDNNNYVTQGTTTTTSWRKVLLHYTTNTQGGNVPADATNVIYAAKGLEVQPSTGVLSAGGYIGPGSVEFIKGTQTASTNAWTGVTKEAALYDGKMIMYVLPYAGTSTGATLNLTLSGGGTTGAKSIYRYAATTAVTTHFAAGSRILMIYDSSNTRWNTVAYYNSNTTYSAGTGLSLSSTTFNHSNSVTAVTTEGLRKVKYDAQGHITGSTAVAKADITGLGIPGSNTTYSAGNGLKLSSTTFSIQYAVGDVIVTSTNTNPSGTYGGTWTLINKQFASAWIEPTATWNNTYTDKDSSRALYVILNGNTVEIRCNWTTMAATMSDTTRNIFSIPWTSIGLNNLEHAVYTQINNDGGNAIGLAIFTTYTPYNSSGTAGTTDTTKAGLVVHDWVTKVASGYPAEAYTVACSMIFNCRFDNMKDSFCDQFVWKRTA